MNFGRLSAVPRFFGKRPWIVIAAVAVYFFLVYVPFIPFRPYCFERGNFHHQTAAMGKEFRRELVGMLAGEVDYLAMGDRVLLTFDGWLNQGLWASKITDSSAWSILITRKYVCRVFFGGPTYAPIDPLRDEMTCDLLRSVVVDVPRRDVCRSLYEGDK